MEQHEPHLICLKNKQYNISMPDFNILKIPEVSRPKYGTLNLEKTYNIKKADEHIIKVLFAHKLNYLLSV